MSGMVGTASGVAGGGVLGAPVGFMAGEMVGYPFREGATAIQGAKGKAVIDAIANRPAVQQILNPNPAVTAPAPSVPFSPAAPIAVGAIASQPSTQPSAPNPTPAMEQDASPVAPIAPAPQSSNDNYLQKLAQVESGGNPNATNPNSTASGPYQFTDATWRDMVMKYGKQTGIRIQDKADPAKQSVMAKLLTDDNAAALTKILKRPPTDSDLYVAHFLGIDGAKRLMLNYASAKPATDFFPAAAKSNRTIFYDRGRPRTPKQVYQVLASKMEAA